MEPLRVLVDFVILLFLLSCANQVCSWVSRAGSIDHQKFYLGIRILTPTSWRHLFIAMFPLVFFSCVSLSMTSTEEESQLPLTFSTDTQQPSICGHWDVWQQSFFWVGHCSLPNVHMTFSSSSKRNSGLFHAFLT